MKLQVLSVKYEYNRDDNSCKYSGLIQGPDDKVTQLKRQLIQEFEYTDP